MYGTEEESLSLARFYRPSMFDDTYIGNKNTKKAMIATIRAAEEGRHSQIHLFTGGAGTGKTTSARIMAKYYRCEHLTPEGHACNECDSCLNFNDYILTGRDDHLYDFRELDSTTAGTKEAVDNLIEEAYHPIGYSKYRIYIFDECHEISKPAQQRLLKFLEEPPENIIIFLCTTDPDRMLETIISRCRAKYEIVKPRLEELLQLLQYVCDDKGFIYDMKALRLIATHSDLAQRKALNELDAVSIENNMNITYDFVVEKYQFIADKYFKEFYGLLLADAIRIDKYIDLIGRIKEDFSIKQFVKDLISFTTRGLYVVNGVQVVGLDEMEIEMYKSILGKLNVVEVASLLTKIVEISRSKEAELLLLQLGFIGLRNDRAMRTRNNVEGVESNDLKLLDHDLLTPADEHNISLQNHAEVSRIKETDITKFVEEHTEELSSADAIANLFGFDKVEE